eukprot:3548198-Rhodomonas_salina.1
MLLGNDGCWPRACSYGVRSYCMLLRFPMLTTTVCDHGFQLLYAPTLFDICSYNFPVLTTTERSCGFPVLSATVCSYDRPASTYAPRLPPSAPR